ncbi:oxygenase MpaB family protein [Brevibacterium sediminis]|uniref:ER-bound oxygenase mpaB/mpaB'/Rubber oxygenase catalytic domain-containing protein n=1 Tax=Brevibacterium sediminis TaxID=1857024 RepID=A0ABQ1LXJ4_9MICO|nr:oxygenase MpaB family protein [Brevibacterium sediminis]GGC28353.1 hypothetical protein GCM10010974_08590 [Brevibacterium sediminis]
MTSNGSTPRWPTGRGIRSGIVLQFGADRADILARALTTGDPLADAVVDVEHTGDGKEVRSQLRQGVTQGLASISDPHPAIAALLADAETLPDYASDEVLDTGSLPFFTMPSAAHIVSLSAGALIRVYQSPSIAEVLTTTGRLIDGADRRIRETGTWVSTAMLPGSLRPGEAGYVATLQVRMLHARMRHLALTRGYDENVHGAPINQVDLARTWIDFTLTSLEAEAQMGLGLTTPETESLYRYWWVLAHLLGIRPELVEGIQSNAQAQRLDDMLQAVTGPLIPEAQALATATLKSVSELVNDFFNVPTALGTPVLHALARRFHRSNISDEMGLRHNATADRALNIAITRIRRHRTKLRSDPVRWQQEQDRQLEASRAQLSTDPGLLYAQ